MSMPSNNKIEDRALGALRNIIDDHATMGHEFHSMDKEMSWDGYIWIYKDINGTKEIMMIRFRFKLKGMWIKIENI